ncbi:SDR family NAD(P)-dependent oxidoreductase [Ornithinimicrobium sp. Y1694]|uniref:SDR family NAD(P)-dependent oxidoreductase n=1 Tax=Ornithinimicrobium sp. Y1694 TaxID=3418590 RepID=UPI003CF055AE
MSLRHAAARLVDTALDRTIVPGFSTIGYAVRRRLPTWPADPSPGALAGAHVAVTGATSGLGAAVAERVSELGGHVHLVVRDPGKADAVVQALPRSATVWTCDLSDLDSVREVAAQIREADVRLDAVVHNAGALPVTRTESAQNHELTMAIHVLGPVLLTDLLLDHLAPDARVVLVTSGGMYAQALPVDDPDYREGEYAGVRAYARSKRTQVELLPILAERWAPEGGLCDAPGVGGDTGCHRVTARIREGDGARAARPRRRR